MILKSFRKKWKKWTLPSKLTAIGTSATIIGVILTIIYFIIPYIENKDETKANVKVKMRIHYSGFFRIKVINTSNSIAKGCNFRIETWAVGAPAEDILVNKKIPDIMPGSDWIYDIDIFEARRKHSGGTGLPRSAIAGYIVITSKNFKFPKAWTFYIPKEGERNEYNRDGILLIKFDYTINEPRHTADDLWDKYFEEKHN